MAAEDPSPEIRKQIETDWQRQEQVTRRLSYGDHRALDGVLRRGRLMIEDMRELGARVACDRAAEVLDEVRKARDTLLGEPSTSSTTKTPRPPRPPGEPGNAHTTPPLGALGALVVKSRPKDAGAWRELYLRARWAVRDLAFGNPRIDFDEILFVRRQWPPWNHQCSHRVGEAQIPGANLCVLEGLSPDGRVRALLDDEHAKGGVGRPDLSYDAKRIVFPYAAPRPRPTAYGYGRPGVRGGACLMYDIYEVRVDGAGLRRLTNSPDSEDTEPAYLPGGRIAFTSSRDDRFVQCGDWALACGIYTMDADGADPRRVTEPKEGEFYPSMLDDGRIMYTRWDYVMKAYNVIQQLWAVNPDGRAASLVYGDHYAFSKGPIAFFEARQIPGTSLVISTGAAHHNTGVGPVMIVDLRQNRGGPDGMRRVTSEVGYPEAGASNTRSAAGWYSSPYPLSPEHFLVAYSFDSNNAARHGYALYLQDVHGNKELVYRASGASCYSPIPLRARPRPRVIPDMAGGVDPATPGRLLVTDIYQGLAGIERGTVKYIRVLETHSKTVRTVPQRCDVGVSTGWDVRGVLGTVPVEEDGSAHFTVPPFRQIFFEALDEDYLEIRRMRNFTNVMPGEKQSCIGCHEPYGTAPMGAAAVTAARRAPSRITPPPWGTGGFSFAKVVQPVLDKHCVRCHDGSKEKGKAYDLRGKEMVRAPTRHDRDQGPQHMVSVSFLNLLERVSYVRVGNYQGEKVPLATGATGSRRSKLMQVLKKGHNKVALDIAEWRSLAAWIDCNAPFYGGWDEIVIATGKPKARPARPSPPKPLRTQSAEDGSRIAARKKEIDSEAGGAKLVAYIDCGLQVRSQGGPASIMQVTGSGWTYGGTEALADIARSHKDITFDGVEIVFDVKGLAPGRSYTLSLTWWDFNNNGRRQSVWASRPDGSLKRRILPATLLPAYEAKKQPPARVTVAIPADAIHEGATRVYVRRDAGANAVVGEVWVTRDR
jgi:hypothetical protein